MIRNLIEKWSISKAFSPLMRRRLYLNLSFRCNASIPLNESFRSLANHYTDKKLKVGEYLSEIADNLENGSSLLKAIKPFIPSHELAILNAGEKDTSAQAKSFSDCAFLVKKMDTLNKAFRKTVRKALIKSMIVVGFITFVAIQIKNIFRLLEISSIPWFAKALLVFSEHMNSYWYFYAAGFLASVISIIYRLPKGHGRLRSWLQYRIFPFTVYRKKIVSSFLLSYGSLIDNSFSKADALKTLMSSADEYLLHYLVLMHQDADNGRNEKVIFSHDLFGPFLQVNLIDLLSINESGEAIKDLASDEIDNTEEEFERVSSRIDSLIFITMAVVILWVVASFFVPTLEQTAQGMSKSVL